MSLTLSSPPPPRVTAVVSAATFQPAISPGEVVSVFGDNIGPLPVSAQFSDAGLYPTSLGDTTVTFNGIAAPLLYAGTGQISPVVPFSVAGQKTVNVVVTHYGQTSPALPVAIMDTSPGVLTASSSGSGPGAILNAFPNPYQLTLNTASNPAPKSTAIVIYATGGGLLNSAFPDGSIFLGPISPPVIPVAPVSLTIGANSNAQQQVTAFVQ